MTKYRKSKRIDEKAISILTDYFVNKHGDRFDLQFHGIKDNTPDTDGFLRLRKPDEGKKMQGNYLNQVVFFQLKGCEEPIKDNTCRCPKRLVEFCKLINLPTILFLVSKIRGDKQKQEDAEIYWYHFSDINVQILNEINKNVKDKIKIPNLEYLRIGNHDFIDNLYVHIESLARKNEFLDLPNQVLNLAIESKNIILDVAALIYLLGNASNSDCKKIAKLLGISVKKMQDVLSGLLKQDLIHKSKNGIIFKSKQDEFKSEIGRVILFSAINRIKISKLISTFPSHKQKLQIYGNLAQMRHPLISKYFKGEAGRLLKHVSHK
ncbi:MAG: hypothetical protein WC348_04535 [Patescibacteria group bacterium]|jgi:hypothetical protein